MPDLNLPLIQAHHPASFTERGVAVPFTTPVLAGTRVRMAKSRVPEFVLPNPAGGRGVYILQWSGVRAYCRPTVHDTLLQGRIMALPVLRPTTLRGVARQLAAEGYAGHAARAAAIGAVAQGQAAAEQAARALTDELAEQVMPALRSPLPRPAVEAERRRKQAIIQAGARLGAAPDAVLRGILALGGAYALIGLQSDGVPAQLTSLLDRMRCMFVSISKWSESGTGTRTASLTRDVTKAIHVTICCAETLLQRTRALTADMLTLLQGWLAAPMEAQHQVERLDWLLDGWDRPCLLWEAAERTSDRHAALLEMAQVVPILASEIQDWIGQTLEPSALQQSWRVVSMNDAWRSGSAVFAMVARNERLRALSA